MALAPLKDEEPEAQEGSVACGSPTAGLPSVRCLWAEDGGVRGRCHSVGTSRRPPGFPGQGFPKRQDQGSRWAHALSWGSGRCLPSQNCYSSPRPAVLPPANLSPVVAEPSVSVQPTCAEADPGPTGEAHPAPHPVLGTLSVFGDRSQRPTPWSTEHGA